MPAVHAAHIHLHIGADESAPTTVAANDHHNGGRVPTGDILVVIHERLGLGVTLSGKPEDLVSYLERCIAAIRASDVPANGVGTHVANG
jgi:hypothetical protein